ncbi:MAG: 50S ribosomal protein L13 [Culicoidibacterales bacterium]
MSRTYMANEATIERQWYIVDAEGKTLGRLASEVAAVLRGKHKPTFTPHVDCGDNVIITNAEKIVLTGNKMDDKMYYNHSLHIGGLRKRNARTMIEKYPIEMVERAIKGMLPHNRLGRQQFKKLFVYVGSEHKHAAQQPKTLEV